MPGKKGFMQTGRKDTIVVKIPNFESRNNYWVAIATVKNNKNDRDKVLSLLNSREKGAREKLIRIIANWKINQFWPKFLLKSGSDWGNVYDGGRNPKQEPQPMILLLVKVPDSLNQRFNSWLTDCQEGKGCKGLSGELLKENMNLSRTEIFFP